MKEITVTALKEKLDNGDELQIIDIRESYETEICSIGGENIPMGDILSNTAKIRSDIPVVIHCRSGKRGAAVVYELEVKHQFENLYNLKGGILAWIEQIDPSMTTY